MPGPMNETKSVSIHYKPNASTSTARPRQKSGPTRRQNCITVHFPIEIEKTGYVLVGFNYYREVHSNTVPAPCGTTFLNESAP